MFDYQHYVPILKSKPAEMLALGELETKIKKEITPLVEVLFRKKDFKKMKELQRDKDDPVYKKTLEDHLNSEIKQIKNVWQKEKAIFLDFYLLQKEKGIKSEIVKHVSEMCKDGFHIIPVTGFDREVQDMEAVKEICNINGCCIRLRKEDFEDIDELKTEIDDFISSSELEFEECDVILDFEELPINSGMNDIDYMKNIINKLPYLKEWRTLILSSTNMPKYPVQSYNSIIEILRKDLILWKQLLSIKTQLRRVPTFSDYAIQHPEIVDIPVYNVPVSLRYAYQDKWIVIKKNKFLKEFGASQQFKEICDEVCQSSYYSGPSFCWGDTFIDDCSSGRCKPGSPPIWKRVGFNRHISYTVGQIKST